MKIKNYKGKILFLLFLILLMSLLLLKMCKTSLPTNENFNESQNLLNKVLKHDKDFLSAYLLLYQIYDKKKSPKKNTIYKELKRLNPKIKIKHTPITVRKKSVTGTPELVTLSLIKLMISQGKTLQAKKNLRLIIKHSKNKRDQDKAKNILNNF